VPDPSLRCLVDGELAVLRDQAELVAGRRATDQRFGKGAVGPITHGRSGVALALSPATGRGCGNVCPDRCEEAADRRTQDRWPARFR
jgi:hypothetical protein